MTMFPESIDAASIRLAHLLFDRPQLCLQELDLGNNRALFIQMDRAGYAASSFLDSRATRISDEQAAVPLSGLLQLLPKLGLARRRAHYLLHIGHCGSTLLSRVLAELDGVLPLREPPPLLDLAQMLRFFGTARMSLNMGQWQQLFGLTMSLLTRTYSLAETAVIKPISHANNLLPHLLAWHRDCRAALIYVDLPSYLASMLKPSNRSETRRALIESRSMDFQRLTGNPGLDSESLEDGQAAALVWLLQMHEFRQAMQSFELRQRLLPVHFDDFLQGPTESLQQLANFFGLAADASRIDAVLQGAVMHSYSKSPAHAYASNRRTQELHRNAVEYAKEIDSALSWAKDIVDKYPALHLLQDDLASSSRLVTQVR